MTWIKAGSQLCLGHRLNIMMVTEPPERPAADGKHSGCLKEVQFGGQESADLMIQAAALVSHS